MRNRSLGINFALGILFSCSLAASAQEKQTSTAAKASPSGQAPDLTGVWMQDRPPATADQYWIYKLTADEPPMTAWGWARYKAAKSSFGDHPYPLLKTNDPVYHGCYPPGFPRIFLHPFPLEIVQGPGEVIMLFEYDSMRHHIFTDGRVHDTSLGPTWMGNAIGHWDGDTLVVDTLNFNDKTWLDRIGHPHSDALHLVERIRRIDHDHLVDDLTVEDTKAYTKPFTVHLPFRLRSNWSLGEQFCEEGESFQDLGKKETAPAK